MIFGTGVAVLTSVYPPGGRGRALGLNTAAVYTGPLPRPGPRRVPRPRLRLAEHLLGDRARRRVRPRPRARPARGRVGRCPAASDSILRDRSSSAPVSSP
ncbi:MAG: hypothetical protein MZV63_65635 [Marinilabiliales bacterium]|nr:hypothetical protein [Marinilabiliales bacterium]